MDCRSFQVLPVLLICWTSTVGLWAKPSLDPVLEILENRCIDCHDGETLKGGVDLESLLDSWGESKDVEKWEKVERAIVEGKMPPEDKKPLTAEQVKTFSGWFEKEFVLPGGVERAGPNHPRRLTREELQNTLEDILHVDIRQTLTNSRLHVIPETVVEKFFNAGIRGASGFSNDAIALSEESVDIQTYARCFSAVLTLLDSNELAREKLFGDKPLSELSETETLAILRNFGNAAFRRNITDGELKKFEKVYTDMRKDRTVYESIKSSFLAILLSPMYLYKFEEVKLGQSPLSNHELATRLSYFLWSSPPDAELQELVENGELSKPEVLKQQVQRMLADPKRVALAENLGGEWFDYKHLRRKSAVNKRSDKMAGFYRTQFEEALLFFDGIIRFDAPIFNLVDADWAFSNRHQRNIYNLPVKSWTLQKTEALPPINIHYRDAERKIHEGNYEYKHAPLTLVELDDANRGGFITLGPTLSATSTENRTSPIRRGVWVLESILGIHFEVPENVPDLEDSQKKAKEQKLNLSPIEILKLHSSQKGCVSCHKYIDPVGFGLEIYDQLGIERGGGALSVKGTELSRWDPKITPRSYADRTWEIKKPLEPGKENQIQFLYLKGTHRLDIRKVRLESGDILLADNHFGYTGHARKDNVWKFKIPKDAPAKGWRLTAEIKGDGGNNSHGVISLLGGEKVEGPSYKLPNGKSFTSPAGLKELLLSDYRDKIIDNAIKRVLAYALGRKVLPTDRPAIRRIKESLAQHDYRMNKLIEEVVLSYPFLNKEHP